MTRECRSFRVSRSFFNVVGPTQSRRDKVMNALKAETASSSHLSVIHINAGTRNTVIFAKRNVSETNAIQTNIPDRRPYTSLYWAISSHVSQIGPVFLKLCTPIKVATKTGVHNTSPGRDMDIRQRNQKKRMNIRSTIVRRRRGRRMRSSLMLQYTSLS